MSQEEVENVWDAMDDQNRVTIYWFFSVKLQSTLVIADTLRVSFSVRNSESP